MSTTEDHVVLGPESAGAFMTPDEFDAVQDWHEEYVYELINGVLIVTPPPATAERVSNDVLGRLLWAYHDDHPQGHSLSYTVAEHQVVTRSNRRRADRVIWTGFVEMPDLDRDPPTIVVEFVSRGRRERRRDYEIKRDEYREAGISEYWIIDRFRRQMTVFRRSVDATPEVVLSESGVYQSPLLPGFELPLARVLAESDLVERPKKRPRRRK